MTYLTCSNWEPTPRSWCRRLAAGVLLALLTGCSASPSSLTLLSTDGRRDFNQNFTYAYVGHSDGGDTDIVLASTPELSDVRGPLAPGHSEPRQLVHVQVYWKPLPGGPTDHLAASNAAIDWYVLGDDWSHGDVVQYSGIGFVNLDQSHDTWTVTIRKASLSPVLLKGDMRDPLGPSTLTGHIVATDDADRAHELLMQVKDALAQSGRQATALPPRSAVAVP